MRDQPIEPGPTALQHPRFRVIPRGSKQLVIFFSDASTPDNVFQWDVRAKRLKASVILVNNGPDEWYQGGIDGLGSSVDEVIGTIQRWADHLGATRLYTVGTGMGGTGALLYGAKLNANALVFSPDVLLSLPLSEPHRLMPTGLQRADLRDLLMARTAGNVDIFSAEGDPVDLLSAAHLTEIIRVNVISILRTDSKASAYLHKLKLLNPIVDAFLADQPLPDLEAEGVGAHIPGLPESLYEAFYADSDQRFADAERHARQALELYPEATTAAALLGKSLMEQGRFEEALPIVRDAAKTHPSSENRFMLASAFQHTGDLDRAVTTHKRILDLYPKFGRSHYALGQIDAHNESWQTALKHLETAVAIEPENQAFQREMVRVRGLAGNQIKKVK